MWWSVRGVDFAATLTMVAVVGGGGVLAVTGPLASSAAPAPSAPGHPTAAAATEEGDRQQDSSPAPAKHRLRTNESDAAEKGKSHPAPRRDIAVAEPAPVQPAPPIQPIQPTQPTQPPPLLPPALGGSLPSPGIGATASPAPAVQGPVPEHHQVTPTPTAVELVVSSFNVLGTSHTRHGERGFAPGPVRTRWAAELIRGHDVDIVGLQELQRDQMHVIMGALGGYGIFPGPAMERHASVNSIMWRTDTWSPVQTSTVGIPYFKGAIYPMPYIRLRHRATGEEVWVANFHNPASTKRAGNNARWRVEARRRQIALANKLYGETGVPVIFTGDMNERGEYFCPVVAATALEASNGGTASETHCDLPPNPRIDWIFGTPEVDWLSSIADRGELVQRTSDHPMVVARGRLDGG